MDLQERLNIEAECRNLVLAFGRGMDDGDAAGAAALFAADGVWDRQGELVTGPQAIRAAIEKRPKYRLTRHIFTNLVINVIDGNRAEGRAYYTVYLHDGPPPDGGPLPRPLGGPERMGDYLNKFVRTAEGWRITYNAAKRIFAAG